MYKREKKTWYSIAGIEMRIMCVLIFYISQCKYSNNEIVLAVTGSSLQFYVVLINFKVISII